MAKLCPQMRDDLSRLETTVGLSIANDIVDRDAITMQLLFIIENDAFNA